MTGRGPGEPVSQHGSEGLAQHKSRASSTSLHAGQLGAEVDDADDCFRAAPAEKAPAGSASLSSSPCCTTPRTCAEAEKIVAAIGQASFFIVVFPNMIWHFVPESASNFLLFLCTRCPACAKFIPLMPLVYHYPSLSHVSQGACTYRRHRHSHKKSEGNIARALLCLPRVTPNSPRALPPLLRCAPPKTRLFY